MKSFTDIIKVETQGKFIRGTVDNRDMLKFLSERATLSRANVELEVEKALGSVGFNPKNTIRAFVSPANHTTVYEQESNTTPEK